MSSDLRFCRNRGWLVGPPSSIPAEPEEYCGQGMLEVIGCSNLACSSCGAKVLVSETARASTARLYACRCDSEPVETPACLDSVFTTNEGEEYRTPRWACAGHPPRRVPFSLAGVPIDDAAPFEDLVPRCLRGWAPEGARERERQHPPAWLHRLHASLAGTGLDERLARAVALLLDGEDRALIGAALRFYESFPEAAGYDRVLALWDRGRDGVLAEPDPGAETGALLGAAAFEALAAGAGRDVAAAIARLRALLGGPLEGLVSPVGYDPKRPPARQALVERLGGRILMILAGHDNDWLVEHAVPVAEAAVRSRVKREAFEIVHPISVVNDRRLDEVLLALVAAGHATPERAAEYAHACLGAHPRRAEIMARFEGAPPRGTIVDDTAFNSVARDGP